MGGHIAVVIALDEAHLGSAIGQAEAADIHAEAVADLHSPRGLVDVSAHQKTGVVLGQLSDGLTAHVATSHLV